MVKLKRLLAKTMEYEGWIILGACVLTVAGFLAFSWHATFSMPLNLIATTYNVAGIALFSLDRWVMAHERKTAV